MLIIRRNVDSHYHIVWAAWNGNIATNKKTHLASSSLLSRFHINGNTVVDSRYSEFICSIWSSILLSITYWEDHYIKRDLLSINSVLKKNQHQDLLHCIHYIERRLYILFNISRGDCITLFNISRFDCTHCRLPRPTRRRSPCAGRRPRRAGCTGRRGSSTPRGRRCGWLREEETRSVAVQNGSHRSRLYEYLDAIRSGNCRNCSDDNEMAR